MTIKALRVCLIFIIISSLLFPVAAYIGIIAALMLAVKGRLSRQLISVLKNDSAIAAVLVSIVVSAVFSKSVLLSMGTVVLVGLNAVLLLIIAAEAGRSGWESYKKLLNGLSLLVCLYGLYQYFSGNLIIDSRWTDINTYGALARVYSTLSNPNIFAAYLAMNLSFAVPELYSIRKQPILTANIILSSVCLLLTYSRGGFAGFAVSMLVICLLNRDRKVFAYLASMIALYAFVNGTGDISRADISSVYMDSSSQYRFLIWKSAADMFLKSPIWGNGIGTAWYYLSDGSDQLYKYILHSHNIFLHIAAETGIVGIVASSYFVLSGIFKALKLLPLSKSREQTSMLQGFLGCTAGVLFHGLVDSVIFHPRFSIILMIYYGIYKAAAESQTLQPAFLWPELYIQSILKLLRGEGAKKYKCYEKENEA